MRVSTSSVHILLATVYVFFFLIVPPLFNTEEKDQNFMLVRAWCLCKSTGRGGTNGTALGEEGR
jgi:hypothetical protein